ncbi:hypothetical protein Ciccas_000454 [Cichlidogyrus casuarinus]|uniref:Uncharacterized protein n=1 Tax=Cichlidogyrus casuarinus TaxID=1844966 RepID=A0ABD2QNY6_9PLAT
MATQPKQARLDEDVAEDPHTKKIGEIQNDIDRLNEKASSEILEVEQRYNKLRKPLFDQRSKLIAAIPNFWPTVFRNHPSLNGFVTPEDFEAIQYLRNIEVQEFEDIKSGYRITFTFDPNPFFSNHTLEKEFHVNENGQPSIKCSEIHWYPDKDFTSSCNAEAGMKREPPECFFLWLTDDSEFGGDEIGDIIKDDLWVSPMAYYLQDYEDDDEEDDALDNEDDDDFENDDGEDEEDDDGEQGEDAESENQ